MKPAWLIEEYASSRLTLRWTRATTAPTTHVAMIITKRIGRQVSSCVPRAEINTRNSAANAPTLTTEAMNPVTGVGAPSYTSGDQRWKGTAATLKAKPISNSAPPA